MLRDTNILKPNKLQFLQPFNILFGHIVSSEGMMVDPYKVKVIQELEPLNNLSKVKSH